MSKRPKPLGTVLPTARDYTLGDAHAEKMHRERLALAKRLLPGVEHRVVDGEDRYYPHDDLYAVIGRDNQPKWFHKRADGNWYAGRNPQEP